MPDVQQAYPAFTQQEQHNVPFDEWTSVILSSSFLPLYVNPHETNC